MQPLSDAIKNKFIQFRSSEISLEAFEGWVYSTLSLEDYLEAEDYLKLISADYLKPITRHEVIKIVEKYIDYGEYETWKLKKLLTKVVSRENDLLAILSDFYHLYNRGYYFLDKLGLEYGLAVEVPPSKYSADSWEELSEEEKNELLASFFPTVIEEARKVLSWLEQNKIIITNEENECGCYKYLDSRTETEKQLKAYK